MKARLLKIAKMHELSNQVPEHLDRYRKGDFEFLKVDSSYFIETNHEIEGATLSKMTCDENDHREVESCIAIFKAMGTISNYLARDPRLWVYLVHTELLSYARGRWPIPMNNDRAIGLIRTHYFLRGARGFERDNAASRLWWMASLCNTSEIFMRCAFPVTCWAESVQDRRLCAGTGRSPDWFWRW